MLLCRRDEDKELLLRQTFMSLVTIAPLLAWQEQITALLRQRAKQPHDMSPGPATQYIVKAVLRMKGILGLLAAPHHTGSEALYIWGVSCRWHGVKTSREMLE